MAMAKRMNLTQNAPKINILKQNNKYLFMRFCRFYL